MIVILSEQADLIHEVRSCLFDSDEWQQISVLDIPADVEGVLSPKPAFMLVDLTNCDANGFAILSQKLKETGFPKGVPRVALMTPLQKRPDRFYPNTLLKMAKL